MMTPTDYMRSYMSQSWVLNEVDGSIRAVAGEDAAAEEEEENRTDITPLEAFSAVNAEGEPLLADMHNAAMAFPHKFDKCLNHQELNRIPSLYCYDHTRVIVSEDHGKGDYYHASFVDGYNKKNAYIFAQAPFDDDSETVFWRMVADQKPSMILVFGVVDEKQKRKNKLEIANRGFEKSILSEFNAKTLTECEQKAKLCRTFWPESGGVKSFEKLTIKTTDDNSETHMKTYSLQVKDGSVEGGKSSILMHFYEWGEKNDDELPEYMLDMRASIKVQYIRSSKTSNACTGPVMLVCATGVSKCSIYATVDIIVSRMTEEHTVGFKETMSAIKSQRYGCFRSAAPYMTAREMLMKFAVSTGVVHDAAIGDKPKTNKSKMKLNNKKPKGIAGKMKAGPKKKKK
uniref:Tyrosine-protein phosphatase domain-containing protein n=1 Tax=Caenorhabditis japonica TaxID=281687 RepID=A0A8R1DKB8_CAEJA